MKKVLLGLVAILSMVFLVACGDKKTSEDAKVVRYNLEQNPAQLDPQLNTETVSGNTRLSGSVLFPALFPGESPDQRYRSGYRS